jgi:hypothetical protein
VELAQFEENLVSLSNRQVNSFMEPIPKEWRSGNNLCESIESFLIEATKNAGQITNFVRHLLR